MSNRTNKPTIYDVARLAEVSVSSVSRVLNDVKSVKSDVRERVQKAIRDLNYVPNRTAQLLKAQHSRMLLHVVADITYPLYISLYRSIRTLAAEHGYYVMLLDAHHDSDRVRRALLDLPLEMVDGIIISARTVGKNIMQLLKESGLPVVFTNDCEQNIFDACYPNPSQGVALAVQHLLHLGHKRIAYAGANNKYISRVRMKAYEDSLLAAGLPLVSDLIFQMDTTMKAGYRAGMYFCSLPERPTAILAETGEVALGVIQALYEKQVRMPQDMSLVSCNSSRLTDEVHPLPTALSDPYVSIAGVAFDYLLSRIEKRYDGPPRLHISHERILLERETSGPAPRNR